VELRAHVVAELLPHLPQRGLRAHVEGAAEGLELLPDLPEVGRLERARRGLRVGERDERERLPGREELLRLERLRLLREAGVAREGDRAGGGAGGEAGAADHGRGLRGGLLLALLAFR